MKKSLFFYLIYFVIIGLEVAAQSSVLIEPNDNNGIFSKTSMGLTWSSNNSTNPVTAPTSGQGTRLMWIPSRSAFRVGTVFPATIFFNPNVWDATKIGLYSFATGVNTLANGTNSTAFGRETVAEGSVSMAWGSSSSATGATATASGASTQASGNSSFSAGRFTKASGWAATALGDSTTASGHSSTALGYGTTASGDRATAMGGFSVASGFRSTAVGAYSEASGENSLAAGYISKATGYTAISLGQSTLASNSNAVAMGKNSSSVAPSATAIGQNCMASGDNSTALGFNASTSGRLRSFAIGGHSSNANPQVANTTDYQMMMAFHNYRFWTQNSGTYVDFGSNGQVTATGSYTNVSDQRLKKEFRPLANSLAKLLKTNTYHYYLKSDTASKDLQTGVIAQELREIFPELVHEDDKGMLSVNYVGLVPHLIEAIKELKRENEGLKKVVTERVERLEALLSTPLNSNNK
jgi:hypothetical protein